MTLPSDCFHKQQDWSEPCGSCGKPGRGLHPPGGEKKKRENRSLPPGPPSHGPHKVRFGASTGEEVLSGSTPGGPSALALPGFDVPREERGSLLKDFTSPGGSSETGRRPGTV